MKINNDKYTYDIKRNIHMTYDIFNVCIYIYIFFEHWLGETIDEQNPAPADRSVVPLLTGFLSVPTGAGCIPSGSLLA